MKEETRLEHMLRGGNLANIILLESIEYLVADVARRWRSMRLAGQQFLARWWQLRL